MSSLLLAVLPHALPATKRVLDRLPAVAVGAAYAVTLATGRYALVVGELYRISTT